MVSDVEKKRLEASAREANSEAERAKENKNSIEQEKTPKQFESWSKRVEKGLTEEFVHLTRRVQREKDLQKKEAPTPPPRHHPTMACA